MAGPWLLLALLLFDPGTSSAQEPPRNGVFLRDGKSLSELHPIEMPAVAYSVSALASGQVRGSLVRPQQVKDFSLSPRPSFVLWLPSPPNAVELYAAEGRAPAQAKAYPLGKKGAIELMLQHDLAPGQIYVLLVSFAEGETRYYAVGVGAKDADDFFYRKVFLDSLASTAELKALKKIQWLSWFLENFPTSRHAQEVSDILADINRGSACKAGLELAVQTAMEGLRREATSLRGSMVFRLAVQGKVLAADVEREVEDILELDYRNPRSPENRLFTSDATGATACQVAVGMDPGGSLALSQKLCDSCEVTRALIDFTWQPGGQLKSHVETTRAPTRAGAVTPHAHRWTLDEPCTVAGRAVSPDDYEVSVTGNVATFRGVERRGSFDAPCVWRSLQAPATASETEIERHASGCDVRAITPAGAQFQLLFGRDSR